MIDAKTGYVLGIGSHITVPGLVHSDQGGMYWEGVVTAISSTTVTLENVNSGEVVEVSREEIESCL